MRAQRDFSPSLLTRLLAGAMVMLLVTLAVVGAAIDRAYTRAAENNMHERLEGVIWLILSTVEVDDHGRPVMPESLAEPRLNRPGSSLHGGVMTSAGEWRSPSLTGVEPQPRARMLERGRELFRGLDAGGNWNVYGIGLGWELDDGLVDLTLWAAEDPNRLRMELSGFRNGLWRWLTLAGALIVIGQLILLMMTLRPLRRVAVEAADIEAGRRSAIEGHYPRELRPLTDNLNTLLAAERDNARRYSQSLADLAHALKTPVAVLRAQLDSGGTLSVADLERQLDGMERTIRRQLERAQRSTFSALPSAVEVAPVLKRTAESLERLYAPQGLRVNVEADPGLHAYMNERDLWEICGNLMENAAKYGHGKVLAIARRGAAGRHRDELIIEVHDNGPGVDDETAGQLLARGGRGDERAEGQGLGLAIVGELVEDAGGRLEIVKSRLGGACFRVILPPR